MRINHNFIGLGILIILLPTCVYIRESVDVMANKPLCECQERPNNLTSNILLFGDSIMMQYFPKLKSIMTELGDIEALRPMKDMSGWCGTSYGINQCIDKWLYGSEWDVIHFNWGMHEIAPKMYSIFLLPEEYKINLESIYISLKKTLKQNGTIIWATTTPVPYSYPKDKRNNLDVVTMNKKSMELFGKSGKYPEVIINNLYEEVTDVCNFETSCYPGNCDCTWLQDDGIHFSSAGTTFNSIAVAKSISSVIATKGPYKVKQNDTMHNSYVHTYLYLSFWKICFILQCLLYILLMAITVRRARQLKVTEPAFELVRF